MKTNLRYMPLFLLLTLLTTGTPAFGQSLSVGADFVSRYVWRGADFGASASIQPSLSYTTGALEVGSWASYGVNPAAAGVDEHDLWLAYTVGPASFGVTDYYFPNAGPGFFNFENGGEGGHWLEPYASVTGPSAFPVTLFAGVFAYNDPDHSVYLSATYPFSIDGVDLAVTAAGTPRASALYGTSGAGLTTASLSAVKAVTITESFSIPVNVTYIVNPYAQRSYLVFGLSF